jgi:hypothetical protein
MMAEEYEGEAAARSFPWDEDWLAARFLHDVRASGPAKDRSLFDRVCGDTPLFRLFMQFFGRYEPFVGTTS